VLLTDANAPASAAFAQRARDRVLITRPTSTARRAREQPTLEYFSAGSLAARAHEKIATLPGTGWGDFSFFVR